MIMMTPKLIGAIMKLLNINYQSNDSWKLP